MEELLKYTDELIITQSRIYVDDQLITMTDDGLTLFHDIIYNTVSRQLCPNIDLTDPNTVLVAISSLLWSGHLIQKCLDYVEEESILTNKGIIRAELAALIDWLQTMLFIIIKQANLQKVSAYSLTNALHNQHLRGDDDLSIIFEGMAI
jgi:hypothetical protein